MGFSTPSAPGPDLDERELLLGFIRWQREQVVAAADRLSDQDVRWTPGGRLLPIAGVINHLVHMEWRWIEGRYLQAEFPPREEEFAVATGVSCAAVIDAYWQQAERTEVVVRAAPSLDVPCLGDEGGRGPAHVVLGFAQPVNLRWVLLHLLEETAHHAGHTDSTREMLDGKRMRA